MSSMKSLVSILLGFSISIPAFAKNATCTINNGDDRHEKRIVVAEGSSFNKKDNDLKYSISVAARDAQSGMSLVDPRSGEHLMSVEAEKNGVKTISYGVDRIHFEVYSNEISLVIECAR